ncbi:unnamed protein product [Microthlaspi erraticum]|uniref:Uncharacterized protein n=1 Tax=Microthlaspi erraticum TaxID=1685480 RepID=A0A6D2HFH0_9BRAS|nr:unnamed protein product [Microthlaspi erraticum]
MRRRNHQAKAAETVKKTNPQIGFTFPDPSSSRAHSDLKRKRRVSFVDVDHRNLLDDSPEAQTGRSLDAKTSEFAFFKKLKSDFGRCSETSDSKPSNRVNQNPDTFESRSHNEFAGTDREVEDKRDSCSFSTPIHTGRRGSCGLTRKDKEKDAGKSSSGFSRDKDTVRGGNNLRFGESSDEKGDLFSVKRKRLNQWVKDTWFPQIPELTSNGQDLVSVLLSRLFPGAEETHPSRFPKEKTDRVKRRTFLDSPGSKFLKRSHGSYTEVDHSLKLERDRSISWLENSIAPSLQFPTDHFHSSFIPRDPEEISLSVAYPKESVYRHPLLKQKASSLSFPSEETLDCCPMSSLHFRNYKPLSLGYHREESGYRSEDLSHDCREPSSALLLEWNNETASTRKTDDLPLSYHTELIAYPNASTSLSLTDNPWSSGYSSSHDLVARELYPLPLLSRYTISSSFIPATNKTSHFEHEFERHAIDDEDVVAANNSLQTFHHSNSSDCLSRDYTYSPVDHCPFQVPGCEIVPFPVSSISDSILLEASSPSQSDLFSTHDWIRF